MSIIDKHIKSLELDKILTILSQHACCDDTKQKIVNIRPLNNYNDIKSLMNKTFDAYTLLKRYQSPAIFQLKNIDILLEKSKRGAMLSLRDFLDIEIVLRNTRSLKKYRDRCEEKSTSLDELFRFLYPNKELEENITNTIISEEEISDNASGELLSIRRKIKKSQVSVRTNLDKIIRSSTYQKYLQDSIITIRDGRFVIPVKNEYRSEVKGLVHDTSSSGATVFVEPISVVEANNQIKLLEGKEKQEIERILLVLSEKVGDFASVIQDNYKTIIELDMYFAKAKLALDMDAHVPTITDNGIIKIVKGRHPLINKKNVVPIDITVGTNFNTLVVTGPNTGGKTVSLKTLGLITLMTMCGLMIPAEPSSSISVFDNVLVDVGDEQSIEQNLSTFSAHMTNIVSILENANNKSLVILDELGSGTDPVEGAALAIAIIEKLTKIGSKIAATTHYAELKIYALTTEGVENASCEFDIKSLKPTYKLLIGVPGKSNAFAIGSRLGLPLDIIENAKCKVSNEHSKFEEVVSNLEETRQLLEIEKENIWKINLENKKINLELKQQQNMLQNKVDIEIEKARAKAKSIVEQARYHSNEMINELEKIKKENDSSKLSSAKTLYNKKMDKLEDISNPVIDKGTGSYKLPRPLKRGDIVIDNLFNEQGTVISNPDGAGNVFVQIGIMKRKINQKDLKLSDKAIRKHDKPKGNVTRKVKNKANRSGSKELDIRGNTIEEGIMELDMFIDNCVLSGIEFITIIHGKGTGVLRSAIQKHLKSHTNIKSFRNGIYGEGENGVTVAELK